MLNKAKQLQPIDNALVSTLYTLSLKSQSTAVIFTTLVTIFLYSELAYSIVIWGLCLDVLVGFSLLHIQHHPVINTLRPMPNQDPNLHQ